MARLAPSVVVVVLAVALTGCTSGDDAAPAASSTAPSSADATPVATPSPAPSAASSSLSEDTEFGSGTVAIDGQEFAVRGDCDVSRDFGAGVVDAVDDPAVDILFAVDDLTAPGGQASGPFSFTLQITGTDANGARVLELRGAESGDAVYRGAADVVALQDRTSLEFVDAAVLHVEAVLVRVDGDESPGSRSVVADVACVISRPT